MTAYRAQSCSSCGLHEDESERDWEAVRVVCDGCRLIHEAEQGAKDAPRYIHTHLERIDPAEGSAEDEEASP